MHLTRNTTDDGSCKYAVIRLDKLREDAEQFSKMHGDAFNTPKAILDVLMGRGDPKYTPLMHRLLPYIELGRKGDPEECFVLKLKDENAHFALRTYAISCEDPELSREVDELAERSLARADKKKPD